jgi:hypothetical protein
MERMVGWTEYGTYYTLNFVFILLLFKLYIVRVLWADRLDNVGSLTSHNPIGLHGCTFFIFIVQVLFPELPDFWVVGLERDPLNLVSKIV